MTTAGDAPPGVHRLRRRLTIDRWVRRVAWFVAFWSLVTVAAGVAFIVRPGSPHSIVARGPSYSVEFSAPEHFRVTDAAAAASLVVSGAAALGLLRGYRWSIAVGVAASAACIAFSLVSLAANGSRGRSGLDLSIQALFIAALLHQRLEWLRLTVRTPAA